MVVKNNMGSWNLKEDPKRVLFKAASAQLWDKKEVVEAANLLQNPLVNDKRYLFII